MTLRWLSFALVLLFAGCVTSETGGRKAGTTDQRLQAYLDLARGYLERQDYANARRPLEQAIKVDPASAEAHVLMASVYIADGDTALAEREYKEALRYDPRNSMAQNNYGTFLFAAERYKEARSHLKIAADDTTYARRAQAYENLGLTELKLGETTVAEQSFLRALMLNKAQPRSAFELADRYFGSGDFARSKEYFAMYNAMARPTARSLWLGVRLSRVLDDEDQLSSYALALKNLFPDSPEYRLYQDRNW
ncbi:MAG: type IV pilus biogenesis/stability protein PilW [Proteobacteria bacterium]|nr:type IV pilus biogenesis/stability protein PilW [Pseudomonadota bacterium]